MVLEIIADLLGAIFYSLFEKMASVKRMMYSFIWFLNYIKICYLYLNKSRMVGEYCKAYKLKSEVFTNHTC